MGLGGAAGHKTHPDGRIPITIGVAGHRDLPVGDISLYRGRIESFLNGMARNHPGTPVRVLSALAEGADRLVAQVALDLGLELSVVMPRAVDSYEQDFPDSVAEFRVLLARAAPGQVIVLSGSGQSHASGPPSDEHYVRLGVFIAKHCNVLLALWDGEVNHRAGGTAEIVRFRLEGPPLAHSGARHALDAPDRGPVYHVPCRRASRPEQALRVPDEPRWILPRGQTEAAFHACLLRIEEFNTDRRRRLLGQGGDRPPEGLALPSASVSDVASEALVASFVVADRLAQIHQRSADRVVLVGIVLVGIMAISEQAHLRGLVPYAMLGVHLAAFASVLLLYIWHRQLHSRERHLDFRALAESLRVLIFWRLAGIEQHPIERFLRKQQDELQWIREALRPAWPMPAVGASSLELVRQGWIADQARYFSRSAHRYERRGRILRGIALVFFALGLAKSAAQFFMWDAIEVRGLEHSVSLMLPGFLTILGALGTTYCELMAIGPQSQKFAVLAGVFARASQVYDRLGVELAPERAHAERLRLIVDLGNDALDESADWLLMRRERPVVIAAS